MKRRAFITLLGGAAVGWPLAARAQQPVARPRIGLLTLGSPQDGPLFTAAFVEGLRKLGYLEGQNVDIDYRYAAGDIQRLTPLAQELVALKPDVLVGNQPSAARALKNVALILPIVCPALTDAMIPDLVASYARPGGSVTGIAQSVEGLTGKLLELALEVVPGTERIGFLSNPTGASMQFFAQNVYAGARGRGVAVLTEEAKTRDDLAPAFDRFVNRKVQALIVPVNGLFQVQGAHIVELALAARLPTIFAERYGVELGGLASYGVDQSENFRHAAVYVDKILKGAKPGDLPIEFPSKIELVINLKTARALGLDIPLHIQQRADGVIE